MKWFKNKYYYILFIVFFTSCKKINKEEGNPVYVKVESVLAERQKGTFSNSNNVADIWVGTDLEDIGVFSLPNTFPVLKDGINFITIEAGIYIDGLINDRQKYFYYRTYLDTITAEGGSEISITPRFDYLTGTIFSDLGSDDFESSVKRYKAGGSQTIEISEEGAFEGKSGYVRNENGESKQLEIISKNQFLVENDKVNAPVFLEFDYKSTVDSVEIGLEMNIDSESQEITHIGLKSTTEWKHFYINLTQEINLSNALVNYKIYFRGNSKSVNDYIALDNIRLIYLEE